MGAKLLSSPPPVIRLFQADEPEPQPLTLRQLYERSVEPGLEKRSTVLQYRNALNHWERLTSNPTIDAISRSTLRHFREELQQSPRIKSVNTVNKVLRHLEPILHRAAPAGPGNPDGEGLIDSWVSLKPLPRKKSKRRVMPLEDLSRVYWACRVARWPQNTQVPAPLLWQAAFALAYNLGARTVDLFGLTWDDVHDSPECPHDEVALANPWGWITFTPRKTAGEKPEPLILPMNQVVRAHLDAIRGPRRRVFPITKSVRKLHETRRLIQAEAGIAVPYTFQELRKTCNVQCKRIDRQLGPAMLGHAARGVNAEHYSNDLHLLQAGVQRLPQPEAFLSVLPIEPTDPRQLPLFD